MKNTIYDLERFIKDMTHYMKVNGLSQRKFAEMVGFSFPKVSRLVNGICLPDEPTLYKIAAVIGVSVSDYITEEYYIVDINSIDVRMLSIEEIDKMIEKLRTVRREKLDEEWANLNAEQERLLRLKAMEE